MNDLKAFLLKASTKGYATGESVIKKSADGSYYTQYSAGEFRLHDNWFGGEPFGGREVVFFKENPHWIMVYYGYDSGKVKGLIGFLMQALAHPPKALPVRGPEQLTEDDFQYVNKWKGNLKNFQGEEIIFYKGKKVYTANYIGGLVDQRGDQL